MDDVATEKPLTDLLERYKRTLRSIASKRGQIAVTTSDYLFEWEDHVYEEEDYKLTMDSVYVDMTDPEKKARLTQRLTDFLHSIPYAFISKNANLNLRGGISKNANLNSVW